MDIECSCIISWVKSPASFIPLSLCFLFLFSFLGMHVCIQVWAWLRDLKLEVCWIPPFY